MFVLHVELLGLTASFRVPHMFKYHRSLPLPPYTSIIGMFGAAIGKDMAIAQVIFENFKIKMGISGSSAGSFNDTWRVLTTKNPERDVVERQIFYKPRYNILFCSNDKCIIEYCEKAFRYPIYPLSFGRPDDLVNAKVHPSFTSEVQPLQELKDTIIVGIPTAQVEASLFDSEDPTDPGPCTLLYRLPIRFRFINGNPHERIAADFRDFTFIGSRKIKVKTPVNGIKISRDNKESLEIPLLEI